MEDLILGIPIWLSAIGAAVAGLIGLAELTPTKKDDLLLAKVQKGLRLISKLFNKGDRT